ncbi:MAG: tRNA (N6-isopentenyl adenosine(37)-C2)-methylthiotransferase MiaB [Candidatus Hydrogenedentes bacterium]|nr:tRNA (N6-isopentenyl adenosine(37)-C2)-methylthiotransferase MiaB [Candidatus Hydrogenedentota bacterium]
MPPKAYIRTYGCQMNEHDSNQMRGVLITEGYEFTDKPEEASLILLNTCSVRHSPENKVYSLLGTLRDHKLTNPELIIGVGGCVAQQEGEKILKREKAVDMVFGPDNFFKLPEMIAAVKKGARVCNTEWMERNRKIQNFVPEEWVERGHVDGIKAYLAITKGCNNMCTFCIVPFTRGREVSREAENILQEARSLVRRGAKEIWLLGQNVNSYQASPGYRFYQLLDDVSRIPGLERIRFTSPHPKDWNNALSDLMAERKIIANHLHLPFQAGSDRILHLMRRNHTLDEYLEKVKYLQRVVPGVELSADLIVGYPTETEEDFEQTLHCVKEAGFSQLFAFKYSPRPGTDAAALEDDVPREVKEERLARVMQLQRQLTEAQIQAYHGTIQEVLIDAAHPRLQHWMNGRTQGFRPISFHAPRHEIGDVVHVRVTAHEGHWLEGELAASEALTGVLAGQR